ncbi:caspase domain-containing protein [Cyathus striatus]|nr:caspase domain-containing protein [Cyathus striatus]
MSTNQKKALLIAIPSGSASARGRSGEIDGSASETNTGDRDDFLEVWAAHGCYIDSRGEGDGALHNPDIDVDRMKDWLIRSCDYEEENITVMGSKENPESSLWPNKENILKCIKELTESAQAGDHLFFHYAGHGEQKTSQDITEEEDKKDEFMIAEDGPIRDNDLKKHLIDTLGDGITLTAVMDSCNSGTILDLPHTHCNETLKTQSAIAEDGDLAKLNKYWKTTCDNGRLCKSQVSKPNYGPTIICISAAKDHQRAWEAEGESMSQHLINILEENPNPKLEDLLFDLRGAVRGLYENVWNEYNQYAMDRGQEPAPIAKFVQETTISSRAPYALNIGEGVWDP